MKMDVRRRGDNPNPFSTSIDPIFIYMGISKGDAHKKLHKFSIFNVHKSGICITAFRLVQWYKTV